MSNDPSRQNDYQRLLQGQQRSTLERVIDQVTVWRAVIAASIIILLVLNRFNLISLPSLSSLHKLMLISLAIGYLGGKTVVWGRVKHRIEDNMVTVGITPVGLRIWDEVSIPKEDFLAMDVFGGNFVERKTLTGSSRILARGIDFSRNMIVPAGTQPDDPELPDDVDLIGSGAEDQVEALKGPMMDSWRANRRQVRDKEVMKEEVKMEVVNEFARSFEDIRSGEMSMRDLTHEEAERRAEELVTRLAMDGNSRGGEADE